MKKTGLLFLCLALLLGSVPSISYGAEETFTLMVYLCGSDLETGSGFATDDLIEMVEAGLPLDGPVTVLVETGGALEWWVEGIDPAMSERWIVGDDDIYYLEGRPRADMGDGDTLADFIQFCMQTAPADRYGLILWDHGGGSTSGVCYDEFTGAYLTAGEIHDALAAVREADDSFHLSFIGFDACLMATFEMANYVRDFADYMVANEEVSPALGFEYTSVLKALAEDPGMDALALCRLIADAYYAANLAYDPDSYLTISVIDLAKMAALTHEVEQMSDGLSLSLDSGGLSTISRDRQNMRSLGDFSSGGSDMVDLGHFVDVYGGISGADTSAVRRALEEAVAYNRYTAQSLDTLCGLSILVPLKTREDFTAYSRTYDPLNLYPAYSQFITGYTTLMNGGSYAFTASTPEHASGWDMLASLGDNVSFSGSGSSLSAAIESIDEGGEGDAAFDGDDGVFSYSLSLTEEDMAHLSHVEGNLMIDISDDETEAYIDLGYLQNALIDWDNNTVYSLFDGTWPVLEGQIVHMTDQIVTEKTRRSLINAWVNDLDVYLLVVFDDARPQGEIIGYTEGYGENGLPARGYERLQPGDIITPQYYLYVYDDDGEEYIEAFDGDPIAFTGAPLAFSYEDISGADMDFAYTFCLNDIYGDYTFTDFLYFSL